jgi:nicotinamide mononucleotide transporter
VKAALLRGLALTSPLEALAVLLGVVYVLLILKRNRLGWIAGALSSSIYVYLAARARLPMQSLLQAYYVVMSF